MTRYVVALAWCLLVWLGLWRDFSAANLLSGVVLGVVLLALFPFPGDPHRRRLRVGPLVRLLAVFGWSVAKANITVAWEVVTPRNTIREGIVAVPLPFDDPIAITIVSHAIILAPGTMVIDIDRDPETVLFVHVLHLRSPDEVRADVQRLARLVGEALGAGAGAAPAAGPVGGRA